MSILWVVLAVLVGAFIVGGTAIYFLRARFIENLEADPNNLSSVAAPVTVAEEVRAIGTQIEMAMAEQRLQGETQRQLLAQKLDTVRQSLDDQKVQVTGLRSEFRHEVARRDAEMSDIRREISTIKTTIALPEATAAQAALPPASEAQTSWDVSESAPPSEPADAFVFEPVTPSAFEDATFEETTFEEPSFEPMSFEGLTPQPAHSDEPTTDSSPVEAAAPDDSPFEEAARAEPASEAPSFEEPTFEAVSFEETAFDPSSFDIDETAFETISLDLPEADGAPEADPGMTEGRAFEDVSFFEESILDTPAPDISGDSFADVSFSDVTFAPAPIAAPADLEPAAPDLPADDALSPAPEADASFEEASASVIEDAADTFSAVAFDPEPADLDVPAADDWAPPSLSMDDLLPLPTAAPEESAWVARPDRPEAPAAPSVDSDAPVGTLAADLLLGEDGPASELSESSAPPANADDLTMISSIDEEIQARLYAEGVYTLDEIARWGRTDARRISVALQVPEATIMNQWVFEAQAALFDQFSRQAS